MKFESLALHPDILRGISDAGFEHCTPIQEQSLPKCLTGQDVIAQSQTGTGKTAVFLLTIFSRIMAAGPNTTGQPRALVMAPTRELASQIIDDAEKLGKHLPFRSVAVYGGVEYGKQVNALKEGVELVVATPGRMIDLYKSRTLSLDSIEIFVIDEADRMFDMGFAPDIMYIASKLPRSKPRQTMLFSATIDSNVRRLASRYMKPDPVMVEIEPEQVTVSAIDQKIIYVSNEEKLPVLFALLKRPDVERAIIFTNMKSTAEKVGINLVANGIPAKVLTGDVTQARREKIIEGIKAGKINVLVATDVAARGLHIEGVTHVINYDLPDDAANYVHRIGRTARAGKSGKAYSLACEDHVLNLPEIEKYIERKLETEWIDEEEMVKDFVLKERPRRERQPERAGGGGKRPGSGGRDRSFQRDGKRPDKRHERKGPPQQRIHEKAAAGPAADVKAVEIEKALQPEGQPEQPGSRPPGDRPKRSRPRNRRKGSRPPGAPQKENTPGKPHALTATEPGKPQGQGRRQRPPRKTEQGSKPAGQENTKRPFGGRQYNTRQVEAAAMALARQEKGPKASEPAKGQPAQKEEKAGLLKRFLKFLKKS
ncbi:MAG: DEAD/DEAH box helicase [Deltaproteobacteria bacterium]|nr:DEAD/DEAH box helicase [Deltaproteobacteria bacterium]MBZ0219666.1 DEAD/DEAH box helicase [Deltaproteobacteria bacterium]